MVSLLPLMLVALPRLVVPSMEGHNVADDLRASMTDALVAAVRRQAQDYDVLGGNEVQALLHVQAQKQQLACHDSSNVGCLVEIGDRLRSISMVLKRAMARAQARKSLPRVKVCAAPPPTL